MAWVRTSPHYRCRNWSALRLGDAVCREYSYRTISGQAKYGKMELPSTLCRGVSVDYSFPLYWELGRGIGDSRYPVAANTEKPSVVQCANKIASGISIAGVIESGFDTSKHPYATWALDSTLGNTFAGLASIPEDFHTDPIKTYGDIVGGGLSQGLPVVGEALVKVGVPVATSKGLFGVATDALLAGTPLGLGKLGFDALVYAGSSAYCYAHR